MNYLKTKKYEPTLKRFWFERRERLNQLKNKNNGRNI